MTERTKLGQSVRRRLSMTEDELNALDDALGYYALSEYGTGGIGADEWSDEQREHVALIRSLAARVDRALRGRSDD